MYTRFAPGGVANAVLATSVMSPSLRALESLSMLSERSRKAASTVTPGKFVVGVRVTLGEGRRTSVPSSTLADCRLPKNMSKPGAGKSDTDMGVSKTNNHRFLEVTKPLATDMLFTA